MAEERTPSPMLHARDEGSGPVLLLLHGLGGDHTVWNAQVRDLATTFRVIAPDLLGHGRSPAPSRGALTFDALEDQLRSLLAEKQVTAAHLTGLSAGGLLALRFALDEPGRVRSLVLLGSAANVDNHTRAVGERWAETLRDEGYDEYTKRLAMDLFDPDWLEQHLELAQRVLDAPRDRDGRWTAEWAREIANFDVRQRLGRLAVPTLILHGLEDRVVDPSHARYLRQAIRGSEVRLFPATGHLLPIERPEETASAIREWVDRVEAAGPRPP